MKKINYRQYYYGGNYADMELQVPDECSLYEIGMINMSHKVQDIEEETWTKACYVQLSLKILPFQETSILITQTMYLLLIPKQLFQTQNLPHDLVGYYKDKESESKFSAYLSKIGDIGEASPDELTELVEIGKECKKICSICMLRKLTYTGIEASNVCFKDWVYGEAMASMNIINIKFGRIFMEEFTTDENISELFLKESEKIYKSIINNE